MSFGVCVTIFDAIRLSKDTGREIGSFLSLVDDYQPRQRQEPAVMINGKRMIVVLKHDQARRCVFFNGSGCGAYESRPYLCRTYPFVLEKGELTDTANRACAAAWLPEGKERERYAADLGRYYKQVAAYQGIAEVWNARGGGTLGEFLEFAADKAELEGM